MIRVHVCTRHIVPWWYTQTKYDYAKGQKRRGLNTKSCHKPYKLDLEVKGQGHIRIMKVLNTSSLGGRPMCAKYGIPMSIKANKSYRLDMKTWQKPLKLTLRSKVNIESDHECTRHIVWWWYIHVPNMVRQCQTIKKLWAGHETCQKPYKFDLEVKVKGRIWIMNVRYTSSHGDTPMCQIW